MMRAALGLVAAFLLSPQAAAQNIVRERTTSLSAPSGKEVRAGHFEITGGRDCPNDAGVPRIEITQPPANGTLSVREGEAPFGQLLLGGQDPGCGAKLLHGMHIYYTSKLGFAGADVFAYRVFLPRDARLLTTTRVEVR